MARYTDDDLPPLVHLQHEDFGADTGLRGSLLSPPSPGRSLVVGAMCLAVAAGAWHGLRWQLGTSNAAAAWADVPPAVVVARDSGSSGETGFVGAETIAASEAPPPPVPKPSAPERHAPITSVRAGASSTASAPGESPATPAVPAPPAKSPSTAPSPAAARPSASLAIPHSPAAADTTAPASRPAATGPAATDSTDARVAASPSVPSDSSSRPKVSPFRRSHPWAASATGRYYYPSSCPSTLSLPDLVFFRSQRAAKARGYEPAPSTGCQQQGD